MVTSQGEEDPLTFRKRRRATDVTRYWTSEESEAFASVLKADAIERRPELEGLASVATNVALTCAGCGRAIEPGEPRIARWDGWAAGEPVPEMPERVWHDFKCLENDHDQATTPAAAPQPISLASKRDSLEGRLKHRGA